MKTIFENWKKYVDEPTKRNLEMSTVDVLIGEPNPEWSPDLEGVGKHIVSREESVQIPMEALEIFDNQVGYLPSMEQGFEFERLVIDYLNKIMRLAPNETVLDFSPDEKPVLNKQKFYVKPSSFDYLQEQKKLVGEAKEDDIKEKYGLLDGELDGKTYPHFAYRGIVDWVNIDRPKRIKLLDWMAKQIAGSSWKSQKAVLKVWRMGKIAEKFLKLQSQFKERDINNYPDLEALERAHKTEILDKIVAKVREKRRIPEEGHSDLVYQDDRFFVVNPKTTEASCYYGAKTKWCISRPNNSYFKSYTDAGKVFYMIRDDTKKNYEDFFALTVQMRKPTGKIEALWDRQDERYDPDFWPSAYGEEMEEPIMSAIKAHFKENYGAEDTFPVFVAVLNEGKYNRRISYHGGMLYLKWKAKLHGEGDSGGYFMSYQANYIIDYEDPFSIRKKKMGKYWGPYSDEMRNRAFEASKEQIINNMVKMTGYKGIKLEYNGTGHSEPGRILLRFSTSERETANIDNAHYFVSHLVSDTGLQEAGFDMLDEFIDQWEFFMKKEFKNQMLGDLIPEHKGRIKVMIK